MKCFFLFLLSVIPLAMKFPYLLDVWRVSIFEHNGWFILLVCTPLVTLAMEVLRRRMLRWQKNEPEPQIAGMKWGAVAGLIICLGCWWYFSFGPTTVHTIGVCASMGVIACAVPLCFGWRVTEAHVPSLCCLMFSTPHLSYWVLSSIGWKPPSFPFFGCASTYFWGIFIAVAFVLIVTAFSLCLRCHYVPLKDWAFVCCIVIGILVAMLQNRVSECGDALLLDLTKMSSKNWLVREDTILGDDIRFLNGCSNICRWSFFNDQGQFVRLLSMNVDKVIDLHPMDICIRYTATKFFGSQLIYLDVHGKKVQLSETHYEQGGEKFLAYCTFSDSKGSTGDVMTFRLLFKKRTGWSQYRFVTPEGDSIEGARARMVDFLEQFSR